MLDAAKELAEKAVEILNTGGFPAKRNYAWQYTPGQLQEQQIDVACLEDARRIEDRGGELDITHNVWICSQKILQNKTDVGEMDEMIHQLNEMASLFPIRVEFLVNATQRVYPDEVTLQHYSPEHLDQKGQYYGLIKIAVRGWYD